jgi:beta-1,4-mannosyltransferase
MQRLEHLSDQINVTTVLKIATLCGILSMIALALGLVALRNFPRKLRNGTRHVIIVVLGDIGRSPRMQNHAESCVNADWSVDFVGYGESTPLASLLNAKGVNFHYISTPEKLNSTSKMQYLIKAGLRVGRQLLHLVYVLLFKCSYPDALLIQTPPAIPTLAIVHTVRLLLGCDLLIDWHNTSSSILATKSAHPLLVNVVDVYEYLCAKIGDLMPATTVQHLTVCQGMKQMMTDVWRISQPIHVMYDRPPARFRRLSPSEKSEFLAGFNAPPPVNACPDLRKPVMVLSSTSWTEDEDFSILLDAFKKYDAAVCSTGCKTSRQPDLSVFITGRGPLLNHYRRIMSELKFHHVSIRTVWLEPEDYPRLLGSMDVGISLHTSSSGLDLPMKIVDMFGSGLPVIALDYPVLRSEMVVDGANGYVVRNATTMADALLLLVRDFDQPTSKIEEMRRFIVGEFMEKRWDAEWNRVVKPILSRF